MQTQESVQDSRRVIAVAHRGGAALAPENTLAAFAAGLSTGADAVELDVHLSSDGELVVIHDPTLERTTGFRGTVAETPLARVRALDAAVHFGGAPGGHVVGPQRIPTLPEVLDAVRGRTTVQVEIKLRADKTRYPGIEEAVLAALRDAQMIDHAVIISFDFATLVAVKSIEPKVATAALFSRAVVHRADVSDSVAIADELRALGVDFAGVAKSYLDEELCEALRSRNLGVGVWTVDEEADMRRFIAMGVDFITSNRPDLLMRVLGR